MRVLTQKSTTKSPIVKAEDIPKIFSNVEHILKVGAAVLVRLWLVAQAFPAAGECNAAVIFGKWLS